MVQSTTPLAPILYPGNDYLIAVSSMVVGSQRLFKGLKIGDLSLNAKYIKLTRACALWPYCYVKIH